MAKVGYIRVSTTEQNTARQLEGVKDLNRVYIDRQSGKDMCRPEWQKCRDYLREGDELYIHSIDRLSRSTIDLLNTVKELTATGITVVFCTEGLTFPALKNGDPSAQLLLTLLAAIAEFERRLIEGRRSEGIAIAKAAGKYTGGKIGRRCPRTDNKRKLSSERRIHAIELRARGYKVKDIAKVLDVTPQALYSACPEIKKSRRGNGTALAGE